jgi:hypothetical protein
MHTHPASSPAIKRGTAAAMISLLAAGAAAVNMGGPRWGFLGAALLLFCVDWVCHLFEYDHGTDEIERYYNPPVAIRTPVRQRTRSLALTPLSELES